MKLLEHEFFNQSLPMSYWVYGVLTFTVLNLSSLLGVYLGGMMSPLNPVIVALLVMLTITFTTTYYIAWSIQLMRAIGKANNIWGLLAFVGWAFGLLASLGNMSTV